MNAESIFLLVAAVLLPILCYISGRLDGIAAAKEKYDKYYEELCRRLIEAIRRAESERED